MLASTAPESPVKTKSEGQNVPLISLNVQQTNTGDLCWALVQKTTQNGTLTTSGLLKSGNLVKCWKQELGDPYTATESNLSLKSRPFLHRVRKILDHSPEDAMQDTDKRPF